MTDDRLSEATRALRETEEVSELEARSTRARVMNGLHQTRVRRRTRLVFLLPIAATFVAVSAWGAANGKVQHAFETIQLWIAPAAPTPFKVPAQRRTRPSALAKPTPPLAPSALAVPVPALEPVPSPAPAPSPAPEPTSALAHASAPVRPASARALAPSLSATAARSASLAATDPLLALYRTAHTAHFVDHDPARALAAWDAYLAAAPSGPFAPEARYNRALSLVRLGRKAEARTALEPFASGAQGGYRQDEARALLERLAE